MLTIDDKHVVVVQSHEKRRKCGFRHGGESGFGLYLCGSGLSEPCERLPFPLESCPFCGYEYTFFRAISGNFKPELLLSRDKHPQCDFHQGHNHTGCVVCSPELLPEQSWMMWVGSEYTPQDFVREALEDEQGVSKRIPFIPKEMNVGEFGDYVFLAHKKACIATTQQLEDGEDVYAAGIFYVFKATRLDIVIDDEEKIPDVALDLFEEHEEHARIVKVTEIEPQLSLFHGGDDTNGT